MVANTGTYVDSPFPRYADGKDLSELPLASLADLPGIVVRRPHVRDQPTGNTSRRSMCAARPCSSRLGSSLAHRSLDSHQNHLPVS